MSGYFACLWPSSTHFNLHLVFICLQMLLYFAEWSGFYYYNICRALVIWLSLNESSQFFFIGSQKHLNWACSNVCASWPSSHQNNIDERGRYLNYMYMKLNVYFMSFTFKPSFVFFIFLQSSWSYSGSSTPVTREEFLLVLAKLQGLHITASFYSDGQGFYLTR